MARQLEECLERFRLGEFHHSWGLVRRGIEKESLRVSPQGSIALSPHPAGLGSALTNPYITTDFSEALLEFITPVSATIETCLEELDAIHRFTYLHLENDEVLWACSMPCPTGNLEEIPLAQYGNSNIGRLKTLYRLGLSHRYGSLMQTIAGIHYNFSMPDAFWPGYQQQRGATGDLTAFRTASYLSLIRNFHRFSWLLIYLFGASPVTCKCFARGRQHQLQEYDDGTLFLPHATCLRMGDLGYRSEAQKSLFVCYNDLDSYVKSLGDAISTTYPPYQAFGNGSGGDPVQINSNLLQLENEFYSTIRPKRITLPGERPLSALQRDGIEYVEVRALDLNPFEPVGINAEQATFLDAFLVYCLLADSPQCDQTEQLEISSNLEAVINQGRDTQLQLTRRGSPVSLQEWAGELLDDIAYAGGLLDGSNNSKSHGVSLAAQRAKVSDPSLTPSGRLLAEMKESGLSFYRFAMGLSQQHREFFTATPLNRELLVRFESASATSLQTQKDIESSDQLSFEQFVAKYNAYRPQDESRQ